MTRSSLVSTLFPVERMSGSRDGKVLPFLFSISVAVLLLVEVVDRVVAQQVAPHQVVDLAVVDRAAVKRVVVVAVRAVVGLHSGHSNFHDCLADPSPRLGAVVNRVVV